MNNPKYNSKDIVSINNDKYNYYKSLFDTILDKDVSSNNINFILSLKSLLPSTERDLEVVVDKETKEANSSDFIYRSFLYIGRLDFNSLKDLININKDYIRVSSDENDFVILIIKNEISKELETTELNESLLKPKDILLNGYNKISIYELDVISFLKLLSKIQKDPNCDLHLNLFRKQIPILIFNGISLSTIKKLFNYANLNLYGGSSTLRHKLSEVEFMLSKFLYVFDLNYKRKFIT